MVCGGEFWRASSKIGQAVDGEHADSAAIGQDGKAFA